MHQRSSGAVSPRHRYGRSRKTLQFQSSRVARRCDWGGHLRADTDREYGIKHAFRILPAHQKFLVFLVDQQDEPLHSVLALPRRHCPDRHHRRRLLAPQQEERGSRDGHRHSRRREGGPGGESPAARSRRAGTHRDRRTELRARPVRSDLNGRIRPRDRECEGNRHALLRSSSAHERRDSHDRALGAREEAHARPGRKPEPAEPDPGRLRHQARGGGDATRADPRGT